MKNYWFIVLFVVMLNSIGVLLTLTAFEGMVRKVLDESELTVEIECKKNAPRT